MVLPIGLMCCQHQHLGYLPIFGCIGCVQHHVGNVAIGERLYAFVTDRVRTSTSEWVSISLISFNFSVFRPLIMRLWPDVANLRAQFCPIPLVAPVVKAIFLTVIVRFEWGSKKNWVPVRFVWVTTVVAGDCKSRQIERAYQGKQGVNAVSGRSLLY